MLCSKQFLLHFVITLAFLGLFQAETVWAETCPTCASHGATHDAVDGVQLQKAGDASSEASPGVHFATALFRITVNNTYILDVCQRPETGAMIRKVIKDRVLSCPYDDEVIKEFVAFLEITEKEMTDRIKTLPANKPEARYWTSGGQYSCQEVLQGGPDPATRADTARKLILFENYVKGKIPLETVIPVKACKEASRGFHDVSKDIAVRVVE